jgi:hypothetical protein
MKLLTKPYNVEMKTEGRPTITWKEFKTLLETNYKWKYDDENKGFYIMVNGKKRFLTSMRIEILADFYGHYDDMGEYLDTHV